MWGTGRTRRYQAEQEGSRRDKRSGQDKGTRQDSGVPDGTRRIPGKDNRVPGRNKGVPGKGQGYQHATLAEPPLGSSSSGTAPDYQHLLCSYPAQAAWHVLTCLCCCTRQPRHSSRPASASLAQTAPETNWHLSHAPHCCLRRPRRRVAKPAQTVYQHTCRDTHGHARHHRDTPRPYLARTLTTPHTAEPTATPTATLPPHPRTRSTATPATACRHAHGHAYRHPRPASTLDTEWYADLASTPAVVLGTMVTKSMSTVCTMDTQSADVSASTRQWSRSTMGANRSPLRCSGHT
jgi:hypothetical protein